MFNHLAWWRAMPIGLSCLLHAGLIGGLVVGQHWLISAAAVQPPVLPVQLVTLEAAEPPRERPASTPPRRERAISPRRPAAPPRPPDAPAARIEEPTPQPVAPAPAYAPPETAPAPTAGLPVIDEPAPAPASPAPGSPPVALGLPTTPPPAAVAAKPPGPPEGLTRTARPQGGYQVRPAYPSAPRRLGIQGTSLLRVHVLADGGIGDVLVERSAGHPDLDRAAMEAVRRWRFEPARRGPDAVAMWVLLPVEFRLTQ